MAPRRKRARRLRSKGEKQNSQNKITNQEPFGHPVEGPQDASWHLLRQSHSAEEVIVYKPKRISGVLTSPSGNSESTTQAERTWINKWGQSEYTEGHGATESESHKKGYHSGSSRAFQTPYPEVEEYGGVPISSTHINIWPTTSSGAKGATSPNSKKAESPEEEDHDDDSKAASGDQSISVSTMYQQLNIVNSNNQKGRTHITGNHVHVQTRDFYGHATADNQWIRSIKTSKPPRPSFQRGIQKSNWKMSGLAPVLPSPNPYRDGNRRVKGGPFVSSPPPDPQPTEEYSRLSDTENNKELNPPYSPILVVLDLNGALLARSKNLTAYQASKKPIPRPGLTAFLDYLFGNFYVMVWSSAQPRNVTAMVDAILTPEQKSKLLAIWARDTLGLSPAEMNRKVVVYKNLERIWGENHRVAYPIDTTASEEGKNDAFSLVAERLDRYHHRYHHHSQDHQHRHLHQHQKSEWSQFNTVLVDDSAIKAKHQPFNHIEVSEWNDPKKQKNDDVLMRVTVYLEVLKKQSNVSAFIRKTPFLLG